jgi:hypothetical protein
MKNLSLFFLLVCTGCDYYDGRLHIHNTTSHSIVVETSLTATPAYPSVNHTAFYLRHEIKPGAYEQQVRPGRNAWNYDFAASYNHKLNILIYDYATLQQLDNINALNERKLYRTLALSQAELDSVKWEVAIH